MANTTTVNSELFVNLLADSRYAAAEASVARQLTSVYNVAKGQSKTVQIPVWAAVSAANPGEGSAFSAANTNTTSSTITMDEYGVYHQVTDLLADSVSNSVVAQLGEASGRAMAEKIDEICWATFSSFTGGTVGASGTELTLDLILKAAATLKSGKVPGPYYAVIDPRAAYNLKKEIGAVGGSTDNRGGLAGSDLQNRVLNGYFIGTAAGVEIYESSLITEDSAEAMTQGVFAPSAIGLAMRGEMEMETQRQAKERATDVVMKMTMGAAAIQPTHGVKLITERVID